jgi:hypothetical protein
MMAGVQADLAALKVRIAEMMGDWVAYEKIGGRCSVVFRGTQQDCHTYVFDHPTGPNGGSTHIAHRPRRTREIDDTACLPPRSCTATPCMVTDPRALTERMHRMNGGMG